MKTRAHLIDISTNYRQKMAEQCYRRTKARGTAQRLRRYSVLLLPGLATGLFASPLLAADAERGRLLYENHCQTCHTCIAHTRKNRKSQNINDLRYWTVRWSAELELGWGFEEIEALTLYLNNTYYKFVDQP